MTGRLARWSSLVGATFMLVACGGTTPPAATGPGGGGATPGPVATQPAATTPAATQAGGGGGFTGGPCSLLTVAEIEGVIGVSGWTTQEFPMQNETGQCLYNAAASIVATSVTTGTSVEMLWSAYSASGEDAALVPGIGERAVFLKSTEGMFFVKNGVLIGLTAGTGADGYDKRLEYAKALGAIIAGRL